MKGEIFQIEKRIRSAERIQGEGMDLDVTQNYWIASAGRARRDRFGKFEERMRKQRR